MSNVRLFDPEVARQWMQPNSKPWLTMVIIGLNLAVFLAMCITSNGRAAISPTVEMLTQWQANSAALTLIGEPWRLITACFVHIGFVHILFNMIVLWQVGTLCEALYGHRKYFLLYFISGIAGSVVSDFFSNGVSAGASGAIAGLMGAYVALLTLHRQELKPGIFMKSLIALGAYLLYCVIYGFTVHADHAAHFGGLATGYLLGLALVPQNANDFTISRRSWLFIAVAISVITALFFSALSLDLTGTVHWQRAANLTKAKQYAEALKCWQDIVTHYPNSQQARRALAAGYLCTNQPEEALAAENASMKIDKPQVSDYSLRAHIYSSMSNWDNAIKDANEALRLNPNDTTSRFVRCDASLRLDKLQPTLDDATWLVEHHPNDSSILLLDARVNLMAGNLDKTLADCQVIEKDSPKGLASLVRIVAAVANEAKGDYKAALSELDEAAAANGPDSKESRQVLHEIETVKGTIYLNLDQADKCKELVADLLKKDPKDWQALNLATLLAWKSGDFKLAQKLAKTSYEADSKDITYARAYSSFLNCQAAQRCGNKNALELVRQAAATLPEDAWVSKISAYLLGKLPASDLIAEAATPGQLTEAHTYIGLQLAKQGQVNDAMEQLSMVVQNGMKDYSEYFLASSELKRLGTSQLFGPRTSATVPELHNATVP